MDADKSHPVIQTRLLCTGKYTSGSTCLYIAMKGSGDDPPDSTHELSVNLEDGLPPDECWVRIEKDTAVKYWLKEIQEQGRVRVLDIRNLESRPVMYYKLKLLF